MYREHPVFKSPANPQVPIWRFMDFSKFVALLDCRALYFARADRLGDPFEGSYTSMNVNSRSQLFKGAPSQIQSQMLNGISSAHRLLLYFTYINCWHMNEHESAAMWRIYLGSEEGIAIRSTYLSLRESLRDAPQPVQIGTVTYLNYLKEWMPEDNIFYPFLHKRLSFEHEHELRAIYQELPTALTPADRVPETESGVNIPVDLDVLIGQVYVAPTSADWYFELVKSITNRYLPGKQVLRSGLDDDPVY